MKIVKNPDMFENELSIKVMDNEVKLSSVEILLFINSLELFLGELDASNDLKRR